MVSFRVLPVRTMLAVALTSLSIISSARAFGRISLTSTKSSIPWLPPSKSVERRQGCGTALHVFVGGPTGVAQGASMGEEDRRQSRSRRSDGGDFLLGQFRTNEGEVVDPYNILMLRRDADRSEIKAQYYKLSKKYHPDTMRHRDILPGSCNSMDDVRQHWERIKLSYEILSDRQTRARYDRNSVIADPKAAASRAAMDMLGGLASGVGRGLWSLGGEAVKQASNAMK